MDNGHDEKLASKMSGLALNDSASSSSNLNFNINNHSATADAANTNDGLFQVMKAVEAAEATIRQQVCSIISLSSAFVSISFIVTCFSRFCVVIDHALRMFLPWCFAC